MCLRTKKLVIKLSKKDIYCIKACSRAPIDNTIGPFSGGTIYTVGETSNYESFGVTNRSNSIEVDEGYHTFNSFKQAEKVFGKSYSYGLFIIPKGTLYIDGYFNNEKYKNRVSNYIRYISPYKPKKWWQLIFNKL